MKITRKELRRLITEVVASRTAVPAAEKEAIWSRNQSHPLVQKVARELEQAISAAMPETEIEIFTKHSDLGGHSGAGGFAEPEFGNLDKVRRMHIFGAMYNVPVGSYHGVSTGLQAIFRQVARRNGIMDDRDLGVARYASREEQGENGLFYPELLIGINVELLKDR